MENVVVDGRGQQCPVPVVMATKTLKALEGPAVVEVHVDNEMAVQNVMRLASGKGLQARSETVGEKHFVITMAADGPLPATAATEAVCIPDQRGDFVVAVDTAAMGRGDDDLGRTLMKGFIFAASQLETLPRTMLFYNGGAVLTTEGSVSVEDLKTMEAQGVEILTCGTCLDFYGLKDKLAVGEISNMYTIVEKLAGAGKVIKP